MEHQRGWNWKRRFSGLAFRFSFMVFAATLFTSLVVTWVSIHSIETVLRGELEQTSHQLSALDSDPSNLRYPQLEHDLTVFAPIRASLRHTLGINLLAVLLSSAGAFVFAAWRVRPILALSEGARRISEGETAVEVPDSGSGDEIQVLARTFNQMSARLHQSRLQLESRNEELKRANQALEQLSITDSLTRLHNHRFFQDQFAREAKRVERTGSPLALVLIDIDDFKSLNDRLGHAAGDAVLARVAAVMSGVLRDTDLLCRYGGEEFALLSPQTDLPGGVSLAEKIRGAVAESKYPIVGPDGPIRITVSIGVAEFADSTEATFNEADRALYDAKASGKDCVAAASFSG
jgi:diguanylate cyclase (GGDEF)-like protein